MRESSLMPSFSRSLRSSSADGISSIRPSFSWLDTETSPIDTNTAPGMCSVLALSPTWSRTRLGSWMCCASHAGVTTSDSRADATANSRERMSGDMVPPLEVQDGAAVCGEWDGGCSEWVVGEVDRAQGVVVDDVGDLAVMALQPGTQPEQRVLVG